jgi:hypothetical protein
VRSKLLSAAACLLAATAALAQTPAPAASAAGAPIVVSPAQPTNGTCGTCITGSCLTGTCFGGNCLFSKTEPCKPCTPVYAPAKKTVYSTVTREYCLANRSICDLLMRKCGMVDDCESAPTGETRTRTLLVKKIVPKPCDEGCCNLFHK